MRRSNWHAPASTLLWIALCALRPGYRAGSVLVRSSPDTLCSKPRRPIRGVAAIAAEVAANVRKEFRVQVLAASKRGRRVTRRGARAPVPLDALLQTACARRPAATALAGITEVPAFVLLARFPAQNQRTARGVPRPRVAQKRDSVGSPQATC
jgi:hypothetical protein